MCTLELWSVREKVSASGGFGADCKGQWMYYGMYGRNLWAATDASSTPRDARGSLAHERQPSCVTSTAHFSFCHAVKLNWRHCSNPAGLQQRGCKNPSWWCQGPADTQSLSWFNAIRRRRASRIGQQITTDRINTISSKTAPSSLTSLLEHAICQR